MPPRSDDVTVDTQTGAVTTGVVSVPPPASHGFAPGSIIAGRYRVVALLGRGGMGEVSRADDLTLDQPVALKFLMWASANQMGGTGTSLIWLYSSRAGQPLFGQVLRDQQLSLTVSGERDNCWITAFHRGFRAFYDGPA